MASQSLGFPLFAALGTLLGGCCGYGGPGCGVPWLQGICEARLAPAAAVVVTAVYGDDTGFHPAEVGFAETEHPLILAVMPTAQPGELLLTAGSPGETSLRLRVDGWSEMFSWSFDIHERPHSDRRQEECAVKPDHSE